MTVKIASLRESHLPDAAALVSARYGTLRAQGPPLPARYENADVILDLLHDLSSDMPGVVALRRGQLVGFLTGMVLPEFQGKRAIYSPEWANGARLEESRRIYEAMYAHVAASWAADGCGTHVVTNLANDWEAVNGWHWLGFGLLGADAVRDLSPIASAGQEVDIRRASVDDVKWVVPLVEALRLHLASAPVFWPSEPRHDYRGWLGSPENVLWLAFADGEAVGGMGVTPANPQACTIIRDPGTCSIVSAYVREEARGRGIATALLDRALRWAREQGYERCGVDFESANVLAARFWLRWFEPACFTVMRHIDERTVTQVHSSSTG
jgi:GNAT superfamily N-acetyltransferase